MIYYKKKLESKILKYIYNTSFIIFFYKNRKFPKIFIINILIYINAVLTIQKYSKNKTMHYLQIFPNYNCVLYEIIIQ